MRIDKYLQYLSGCRFCPMCKPFGETSIFDDEVFATRTRGLLLWQIAAGKRAYTPKTSKYIFGTGLDTPSYQWCINHYPVHEMVIAARMDLFDLGFEPKSATDFKYSSQNNVINHIQQKKYPSQGSVLFVPGDSIFADDMEYFEKSIHILEKMGIDYYIPTDISYLGTEAYIIGKEQYSKEQFELFKNHIYPRMKIICDGPYTEWGIKNLNKLNPTVNIDQIDIKSIYQLISETSGDLFKNPDKSKTNYLFIGNELSRLKEAPFIHELNIMNNIARIQLQDPTLEYEFSHSTGAAGMLQILEPTISQKISEACLQQASRYPVTGILCDSILDVKTLKEHIDDGSLAIITILDLLV